jgi:hypothetical protein
MLLRALRSARPPICPPDGEAQLQQCLSHVPVVSSYRDFSEPHRPAAYLPQTAPFALPTCRNSIDRRAESSFLFCVLHNMYWTRRRRISRQGMRSSPVLLSLTSRASSNRSSVASNFIGPRRPSKNRGSPRLQVPLNLGGLLSANARLPSWKSSEDRSGRSCRKTW